MLDYEKVDVDLGNRSYPIFIGSGLLGQAEFLRPYIKGSQVCIVTNQNIAPLYLDKLKSALHEYKLIEVILPDGEAYKTLETVGLIYDALLEHGFERSATLIALGGGVIGDMTGFAAATYQRGVNFIQIPTTLLSQVDSSVGGKTGVNRPLGKNMVGAFYQPQCVIADISTLATLPERELSAGLAEVIKYGLINNAMFHQWLQQNMQSLRELNTASLIHAVKLSCEEKAAIVAADERESGLRAILNFGHTFGHAIEAAMGYGLWLHGEAVAAGMVMAADLSQRLGMLETSELAEIKQLIREAGLPVCSPEGLAPERYLELMRRDKKTQAGNIRFILLEGIGKARIVSGIDSSVLLETLSGSHTP